MMQKTFMENQKRLLSFNLKGDHQLFKVEGGGGDFRKIVFELINLAEGPFDFKISHFPNEESERAYYEALITTNGGLIYNENMKYEPQSLIRLIYRDVKDFITTAKYKAKVKNVADKMDLFKFEFVEHSILQRQLADLNDYRFMGSTSGIFEPYDAQDILMFRMTWSQLKRICDRVIPYGINTQATESFQKIIEWKEKRAIGYPATKANVGQDPAGNKNLHPKVKPDGAFHFDSDGISKPEISPKMHAHVTQTISENEYFTEATGQFEVPTFDLVDSLVDVSLIPAEAKGSTPPSEVIVLDDMDDGNISSSSSSASEIDNPVKPPSGGNIFGRRNRKPATKELKQAMLDYICENEFHNDIKGNSIYKNMELNSKFEYRTYQSIKNTVQRCILPRLDEFRISSYDKRKLLYTMNKNKFLGNWN